MATCYIRGRLAPKSQRRHTHARTHARTHTHTHTHTHAHARLAHRGTCWSSASIISNGAWVGGCVGGRGWRAQRAASGAHRHQCSPVICPTTMAQPRLASPHAQCMGNSAHDSQPVSGQTWVITQTHRSHRGAMAPPHQKHTRDGMEPQLKRTRTHARTYVRTYVDLCFVSFQRR